MKLYFDPLIWDWVYLEEEEIDDRWFLPIWEVMDMGDIYPR